MSWFQPRARITPNALPRGFALPGANSAAARAAARNKASRRPRAKRSTCSSRNCVTSAPEHRAGFVVLGGRSNVGKSTLLNRIVGHKVAIVTPRPQTTRRRILGIRTDPDAQLILIDTPGLHDAERLLNRRMVQRARASMAEADVVAVLVQAAQRLSEEDRALLAEVR